MSKIRFNKKKFLNKDGHNNIAAVGVNINQQSDTWIIGEIAISDCNRVINLDLDFIDEDAVENSLFKCQQIIDTMTETKNFILQNSKELLKVYEKDEKV